MPDAVHGDLLLAAALGLLALAAMIAAFAASRAAPAWMHALSRGLGALAAGLAALRAIAVLSGAGPAALAWWPGFPGQPFTLQVDTLAAPFVLLLGLIGAASFAAMDREAHGPRVLALHAAFVGALLVTFSANHVLLLLLAWEVMTLLSAALVGSDPSRGQARRAVWVMLALSHLGTALLAAALLTLAAHGGGWDPGALARGYASLPAADAARIAWCITLGAAVKLGLVPLHGWLPSAHAEAPAPVSAVMSGVMVTAGLYLMLRYAWDVPGLPPSGWGTTLLVAGMINALCGALGATLDSDAKRVLAWSTVKHVGVLAMATGLAALLVSDGPRGTARLALGALLMHVVGHGLAKATAFLALGQATHGAGSRDLEQLGGLARYAPRAFAASTGAALALAGLPALACFAGEWLLLQALLHGYSAGAGQLRLLAPFAVAALALAGALTVGALVRLVGLVFLGRPRTPAAEGAHDGDRGVTLALVAALVLTLAAGIASPQLRALLEPAVARFSAADPEAGAWGTALTLNHAGASASPLAVVVLVTLFAAIGAVVARASHRGAVRQAPSWSCGTPLTPTMQSSARGFAKPMRLVFEPLLRGRDAGELLGGSGDGPTRERSWLQQGTGMLLSLVEWSAVHARRLQSTPVHVHLALLLVTLVALLLWGRP